MIHTEEDDEFARIEREKKEVVVNVDLGTLTATVVAHKLTR